MAAICRGVSGIFSLLVLLFGAGVMTYAIIATVDSNLLQAFVKENATISNCTVNGTDAGTVDTGGALGQVTTFNIALAAVGFAVVIVAIVGFVSCCRKSAGCFCCYALLLILFVVAEAAIVIVYFAVPSIFQQVLQEAFKCAGQLGLDQFISLLSTYGSVAPYIAIGIVGVQLLAIVFAFCGRAEVKRNKAKQEDGDNGWLDMLRKTRN